jgi:hypothetical protein
VFFERQTMLEAVNRDPHRYRLPELGISATKAADDHAAMFARYCAELVFAEFTGLDPAQ